MTIVKLPPKPAAPAEDVVIDYSLPRDEPWSPAKLYSRSTSKRRLTFLELMVWAINHVESIETRAEWSAFEAELIATRQEWSDRPIPWRGVTKDPEAFRSAVVGMAEVFANSTVQTGVDYASRKTDPLG